MGFLKGISVAKSVSFDRAVDYYDRTRGFPAGVDKQVAAFIAHFAGLKSADNLLEIGIGTGRIALPLAPYVRSISGVDISTGMMRRLREKQNGEVVHVAQGDALHLPFPGNCFEVSLVVHVLHLVAEPAVALRELARVMKPGGRLLHCRNDHVNESRMQRLVDAARAHFSSERDNRHRMIDGAFADLGWHKADEQRFDYPLMTTPGDYLRHIEQRLWSSTWEMSDDEINRASAAVREAIGEHFGGDMTVQVENRGGFIVQVWTPPVL